MMKICSVWYTNKDINVSSCLQFTPTEEPGLKINFLDEYLKNVFHEKRLKFTDVRESSVYFHIPFEYNV